MEQLAQYIPYIGMALIALAAISGNPKVVEYATKAKDWLMSLIPDTSKTIPIEETADLSEALQFLSVHELLEELLTRSEEEKDTDGIMLLGAYGKHVYDLRLTSNPVSVSKKSSAKKGA